MYERPLDRVLSALRDRGAKIRKSGEGFEATCPAHEDRSPSLSINANSRGDVLLTCHAGCAIEVVVAELDLTMAALFADYGRDDNLPPPPARRPEPVKRLEVTERDVFRWAKNLLGNDRVLERIRELRAWAPEALERLGLGLDGDRVVFPLRDEDGILVGLLKFQPNPERRNGSKMVAVPGSRRELFPTPESLPVGGEVVWLVEGEADAVLAQSLGLPAVGVPGVKGWRPSWAARFAGRRVVVCMDCDEPGRDAARRVAADLDGVASEVRVLDLDPARHDGHDISDLVLAGMNGDRDEASYLAARAYLVSLAGATVALEQDEIAPEIADEHDELAEVAHHAEQSAEQDCGDLRRGGR